ncbi:MAG: hypothetical protein HRT94_06920 [Alphaproteobacteria bacterium]|nr:hypothetical protein [Alphaproteobacteria bacterium]
MPITAYNVKTKEKGVVMQNPIITQTKKGGYMAKGTCAKSGATLCAILSKDKALAAIESGEATKGF